MIITYRYYTSPALNIDTNTNLPLFTFAYSVVSNPFKATKKLVLDLLRHLHGLEEKLSEHWPAFLRALGRETNAKSPAVVHHPSYILPYR